MKNGKHFPIPVRREMQLRANPSPRNLYSCSKCPAYCCSYPLIEITKRDVARLARHFGLSDEAAEARFTTYDAGEKAMVLRHRKDDVFDSVCQFLDRKTRRCSVYDARPGVCREYPDSARCGYYEFLKFEREQQDDPQYIATT
jgi:Fe-S-cluster containining protein